MKDKMTGKFGWIQAVALGTALTTSLLMGGSAFAAPQKPAGKGAAGGKGGPGRGGMRGGGPNAHDERIEFDRRTTGQNQDDYRRFAARR